MAAVSRLDFTRFVSTALPDNKTGEISEADVRSVFDTLADSALWHDEATTGPVGPSAYEVAVNNGFIGSEREWLASLIGAAGAQGPAGAVGEQGPAGADGTSISIVRELPEQSYALTADDDASLLIFSDTQEVTVTMPLDEADAFRIGAQVHLINAKGVLKAVGATGVIIEHDARAVPSTAAPMAIMVAVKTGQDRWYISGALGCTSTLPILDRGSVVSMMPAVLDFRGDGISVAKEADGRVAIAVETVHSGGALSHIRSVGSQSYNVTLDDAGSLIEFDNVDGVQVSLPADIEAAVPVGSVVHLVQAGAGTVTVTAAAGATVKSFCSGLVQLDGQDAVATAVKSGPNTWRVHGQLCVSHAFS
ncbi:MAG: hypothetical protein V2I82_07475 [Halieaceae bacterium]|nr:hypothetical protein [Halieaceae bacterium]